MLQVLLYPHIVEMIVKDPVVCCHRHILYHVKMHCTKLKKALEHLIQCFHEPG